MTRYEQITTLTGKFTDKVKCLSKGIESLQNTNTKADETVPFSEILNRIGRQEEKPEFLERLTPLVLFSMLAVIVSACYYAFIHYPQLP